MPKYELKQFAEIHPYNHPGFGCWTAALGDINGDGYDDLAVSSLADTTFIFLGGVPFDTEPDFFVLGGASGLAAGDFDGDGRMDIATAMFHRGALRDSLWRGAIRVYLHTGTWPPYRNEADRTIIGPADYTQIGWSHDGYRQGVITADLNGDRCDDLLYTISDPNYGPGMLCLFLGGPGILTDSVRFIFRTQFTGSLGRGNYASDYMTGDLNGDGCDDLCIFGYCDTLDNGPSYLHTWLGKRDAKFSTPEILTRRGDWWIEWISSNISDVNADGYSDLVNPHTTLFAGAKIFLGRPVIDRIAPSDSIPNQDPIADVGPVLVCPVGDMSGDGKPDLIIGWSTLFFPTGVVYYVYPASSVNDWRIATGFYGILPEKDHVKHGAYPAGDLNGDGCDEVLFRGQPTKFQDANSIERVRIFSGSMLLTEAEIDPPLPAEGILQAFPQPARAGSTLHVRVDLAVRTSGRILLTDLLGRELVRRESTFERGISTYRLALPALPSGSYLLRLHLADGREICKSIVVL